MSRQDFYNSTVWKKTSKAYARSKSCLCERCGCAVYVAGVTDYLPKHKRIRYVVHHKIPLDEINYKDANISLNFDNFMLLCLDCHNREHGDSVVRDDLMFDEYGNLVPMKKIKREK